MRLAQGQQRGPVRKTDSDGAGWAPGAGAKQRGGRQRPGSKGGCTGVAAHTGQRLSGGRRMLMAAKVGGGAE